MVELNEKALEAAHHAYQTHGQMGHLKAQRLSDSCLTAVITAYLAALPASDHPFPSYRFDGAKEVPSYTSNSSAPTSDYAGLDWGDLLIGYQRICAEHGIEPTSADVLKAIKRHDAKEPVEAPKPFCYTASLNLGPHPTIASYRQEGIYTTPLYLHPTGEAATALSAQEVASDAGTTFSQNFFAEVGRDPDKWVAEIRVRLGSLAPSDRVLRDFFEAALSAGVRVKGLSVDDVERIILETEPSQLSDRSDKIWTRRMATALAARLSALSDAPVVTEVSE